MIVKILGSGAGGGVPQWNCNCDNCTNARLTASHVVSRTQSSIAVSENGVDWVLVNASPDLLTQLRANPTLQPARAKRDSGIAAVLLTDAQIDHVTGLLMLRERTSPLPLYATSLVFDDLSSGLPLIPVLGHYCGIDRHEISLSDPFTIEALDSIRFTAIPVASKAPPYSPRREAPMPGDNVALLIEDTTSGSRAFYAPGLAGVSDEVRAAMHSAQLVLVDGTFWSDTEMIDLGLSHKRAGEIGHLSQCGDAGEPGMMAHLDALPESAHKLLIHINNTNPILDSRTPEHAALRSRGIELAEDGMQIQV